MGASEGIFRSHPPRLARAIFSMLKIAVLSVEAKRSRVSGPLFFPYRPVSSSDECQHADIEESRFNEGWEKYSALYFLAAGNEKVRGGRANVLPSARGLADG